MVRLSISSLAIFTSLLAANVAAKDVACQVNGNTVATVDLDTGNCPFTLPAELPAIFKYNSSDDYDVTFYYAIVQGIKYFTDVVNAGNEITVPANKLYGTDGAQVNQVHVEESPSSNSTVAIRRRMLNQVDVIKRDEASDFAESLKSRDGTATDVKLEVVDISGGSSSASGSGGSGSTVTETNTGTKIITITHCEDDKCTPTTVPGTPTVTTCTTEGTVTTYTTYCPVEDQTATITITHCSDNVCNPTTITATPSITTCTTGGTVTTFYTYCPITEAPGTGAGETKTTAGTKAPGIVPGETKTTAGTEAPGTVAGETKTPAGTEAPGTVAGETKTPAGTEAPGTVAGETKTPAGTEAPGTVAGETKTPGAAGETTTPAVAGETNTPTTVAAASTSPAGTSTQVAVSTFEASAVAQGTSLLALILMSLVHLF